jgi:hypothetical protein
MASPAQIEANRRNSLCSTGPTSVAGKVVSRFNALKSGIDAKHLILPGEDPAELENLSTNYHLQFLPGSPVEQFLVDSLTHADWKLRRLRKREAQLSTPAAGEPVDEKQLDRLDRQINTTQRAWFRSLHELFKQIPARIEKELAELEAARASNSSSAEEAAQIAEEIGFVPPKPEPATPPRPQMSPAAPPARNQEPKINLALRL